MTNIEIQKVLNSRGYILESDCADAPTLSSTQIENYSDENIQSLAVEVENSGWLYALYNSDKFEKDEITNRIKYKQIIASYLCNKAKSSNIIHYIEFNNFLNTMELDYFKMTDMRFLIEEICRDFQNITKGHILSAMLVTKKQIPSDGFWDLVDIKRRIGTQSQKNFHNNELIQLQVNLKNYNC